jgi:L-ascorbate metabolism protein UlaG (beta-lactamase superfamily)
MLRTRGNKITYFGHSAFGITTPSGQVILIDPWILTNPVCPEPFKEIGRADIILLTHGHSDHLGDVIAIAKRHSSQVVCIYEIGGWLGSQGLKNIRSMGKGGTQRVNEIEVTLVNAIHSSSIAHENQFLYGGEPGGYIVRLPGGLTLYHAGDTCVFGDMKIIGDLYKPDVACLPIGDHYTMGPREAALAIRLLNVQHVIPMHYWTFPPLTGTPAELREYTQDIAGLEIHALKPGETIGLEQHAHN